MNTRCFATFAMTLALSIVCLLNFSVASQYPPGTWDHTTMATKATLEATHIVVGEVTNVSFVSDELISVVTVRIDKDIKAEIKRVASEATNPVGNVGDDAGGTTQPIPGAEANKSDLEDDASPQTVDFIQAGGPRENGSWVKAVGMPHLETGDYVFLRLKPNLGPRIMHSGKEYKSVIDTHGTVYTVEKRGNDIDDYIIKEGWQDLDFNVLDMTRIVRTTLEQPEVMRSLEQGVNSSWRASTQEAHTKTIMRKVLDIEKVLSLPALGDDAQ